MKSLDIFSQRLLTVALSIAIVLLSGSLFIFSLSTITEIQAEPETFNEKTVTPPWDQNLRGAVGLGIIDNTGYFVIWGNPNTLYKVDLSKARDWYKD